MGRAKGDDNSASILKCTCCGEKKRASDENKGAENDFYKSRSKLHLGYNSFIPICKNCLENLYNEYLKKYERKIEESEDENANDLESYYVEKKVIKRLCMMNDIYYDDGLFDAALKHSGNNTMFSAYMKVANLIQYKKKTYDTTLSNEELAIAKEKENTISYDDVKNLKKVNKKTVKFFGSGFSEDEYEFLQEQYSDWTTRHECKTKVQEEVFKQICFTQLELLKATRAKQDTKDLTATFQKLLETAKLQPKQNHSDTLSETQTFGTLIDKWENTRPLPEIDEELKDVDKIALYIDVFFRGHLAKMMGLKNGLSRLYDRYMKKYTVQKPEYKDDKDAEALFDAIFGDSSVMDED